MAAINWGYAINKPRVIDIDSNNLRKSDEILREMPELQTCIGCGACARKCPRGLIDLRRTEDRIAVLCSNRDKGFDPATKTGARPVCDVSCIGCGLCTTKCKFDAIHLKKGRDWHAGSYETMPIKVAEGVVKRAGSIVKKAVSK